MIRKYTSTEYECSDAVDDHDDDDYNGDDHDGVDDHDDDNDDYNGDEYECSDVDKSSCLHACASQNPKQTTMLFLWTL